MSDDGVEQVIKEVVAAESLAPALAARLRGDLSDEEVDDD